MKLKFGLRVRFIGMFLMFSVMISMTAGYVTRQKFENAIWNQYQKDAIETANLAVGFIDGDDFERYAETLVKDDKYEITQDNLNKIRRTSDVVYIYALKLISDSETIYVFDTWDEDTPPDEVGQLGGREAYDPTYTGIATALETKETNREFEVTSITQFGYNATIYAPILNSAGDAVGVLGVDVAMNDIKSTAMEAVKELLTVMSAIILFCVLVLLMVVQGSFISPVRVLKSCVEEMAAGKLGVQAPVRGNTEITEISRVFNQMSNNIRVHMQEMSELNDGYHKFVPVEVFRILQKVDVTQIRLGDYRETILSVLSMEIRDFDKISSEMESRQLFSFINRIYREAVPAIQKREGVIGEYYKGGFSAFYQSSCQNVLDSAIVICQHFHEVRRQMEREGLRCPELGFGISHGTVMLGIVGDEDRLSTSMLSDQITAAEHLKSVAWKYHSQILMTGTAAAQVPDFSERYSSRFIGILRFKNSGKTEEIYDVYDGDSIEDRERKTLTRDKFEEGVRKFLAREFYEARLCFVEVLKLYRFDYAAREYLYLCNCIYQDENAAKEANTYIEEC